MRGEFNDGVGGVILIDVPGGVKVTLCFLLLLE